VLPLTCHQRGIHYESSGMVAVQEKVEMDARRQPMTFERKQKLKTEFEKLSCFFPQSSRSTAIATNRLLRRLDQFVVIITIVTF